jgi:hypothetical protein
MSVMLKPIQLNEKSKSADLIAQLEKIPLGRMYQASFKAVVRLHVFFTGRTHELFLEFGDKAQALILKKATLTPNPSPEGRGERVLDGAAGFAVQIELLKMWEDTFEVWRKELEAARVEAASIPFGVMAVMHERLVVPNVEKILNREAREEREGMLLVEAVEDGVFSPQLSVILNAASEWLYGDALNLSARVWQVDREARDGMNAVLLKGIANGDSAWNIAKELEQFLGANADCPRWTSTRLYGQTKSEIATGTKGLLSGNACDGSGVSYNALRLARTEIQKAHALATDRILAAQPWVEKEQINLSAAHAGSDICDETVQGGEDGKGIYEVGTVELPLHPNCLCYKTAVLMSEKEFTSSLRGWLDGSQPWSEMDDYAELIGGDVNQSILPNAINLAVWLFSDKLKV